MAKIKVIIKDRRRAHPHEFQFKKLGRNKDYEVYKCKSCPSYFTPDAVIGILSKCNYCDVTFHMSVKQRGKLSRLIRRPHCGCKNRIFKPGVKTELAKGISLSKNHIEKLPLLEDLLLDKDDEVVKI